MSQTPTTAVPTLRSLTEEFAGYEAILRQGGGEKGLARQRKLGRLPVRERLAGLLDDPEDFLELGLWAGHEMYEEFGGAPAAGVVTGIGAIHQRSCMIIANDATVKAGAFFPQTCKKVLRAQRIAFQCSLPIVYLVDSAGAFLPLQDEIFPDEDDFGRIFRNNAKFSAAGLPQYAAIMGNCVAGGAYLPVLCDKTLMTEGSCLYLAGPALVKAAINQTVDDEELGGAKMHSELSGVIDFHEPNDESCLQRIRRLVDLLPPDPVFEKIERTSLLGTEPDPERLYDLVDVFGRREYDVHDLIECVFDRDSIQEFKPAYGMTVVTAYARIGGQPVGIVANQKKRRQAGSGELQLGGVLYPEAAEKAARFIMDCNQTSLPLVFLQDVTGFMVGRDAEQAGIIRRGAKLVNAMSNSTTPKITVIVGGSFGAGNYAMCGKAYDPCMIFAWPNAKIAVMGAEQAANTLLTVQQSIARRRGYEMTEKEIEDFRSKVTEDYRRKTDIRYGAARGWVDAIIPPSATREVLIRAVHLATREPATPQVGTGVFQV